MLRRLFAVALALSFPAVASATLIVRFDVEDLARRSDVVAVVRVADLRADLDPDNMIRTRVDLSVERVLRGRAATRLSLLETGGSVDGVTAAYAGMPRFVEGDRMVVFLERRPTGELQVVGAFQGAFRVGIEAETGLPVAMRAAERDVLLVGGGDGAASLYLDELEARVKAVTP